MKIWLHYVTKNSPRLPEDPGDATDGDACHPDEPTEPPDDAESMRVRDSEERVEARVSEVSTGRADETAESDSTTGTRTESDSDEGMPGSSEDDSEAPGGGTDRHEVVEVEPGGETTDRRNGSVADEDADADVGRVAGEARRGAQVEGESAGTRRDISIERERGSVSALERSMTTDKENDQRPLPDDDDVPEDPTEPPDVAAWRGNEPPSAELEGEWKVPASCEVRPTSDKADLLGPSNGDEDPRNRPKGPLNTSERERERSKGRSREDLPGGGVRDDRGDPSGEAHVLGASGCAEDVGKWPRKLRNASKRIRECSERRSPEDSPGRPREESEDPGGETVVPGGVHDVQERPRRVRNERVNETNAPS